MRDKIARFNRVFFYWLPVAVWMVIIFFLSSFHKLQASTVGWEDFVIRKFAHVSEYTLLFILVYRGFLNTTKMSFTRRIVFSFLITVVYAISDEFHQTFVSGRTGRFVDIGIDSLGAFLGIYLFLKLLPILPKSIQNSLRRMGL